MNIETPFFFDSGNHRLFGVVHDPAQEELGKGFVFCHPFAEEKLWTHRVYVNFARRLAHLGFFVLRFDYMGHGDSEGLFADSDVNTRLADITSAIKWLKNNRDLHGGVGLLGLRFGATLACLAAENDPGLNNLILWEPVQSGAKHMKEMLRFNITTQTAVYKEIKFNTEALIKKMKNGEFVNIDGYDLAWPLFEQANAIDLIAKSKNFTGKVLVVQINRREGQGSGRLRPLAEAYTNGCLEETTEEPFWKEIKRYYANAENLFKTTENWLRKIQ
jgi:exosortase A-associated hydrolase 2